MSAKTVDSAPLVEFGFLRYQYSGPSIPCSDPLCTRTIPMPHEVEAMEAKEIAFVTCYMDVNGSSNSGSIYCDSCGKCRRYARKKAVQRGDCPPEGPYPEYND